jgi:hypothetical protein
MAHPLLSYATPALLLGVAIGVFGGGWQSGMWQGRAHADQGTKGGKSLNPRQAFLSSDDDVVDYDKLARTCLEAAATPDGSGRIARAKPRSAPEIDMAKEGLDRIMSFGLEEGVWSRGAAFRADIYLKRLPPTDAEDFERLLKTAIDRGDLTLQPGAWLPEGL